MIIIFFVQLDCLVLTPFDRVKVNSFLYQFPERTKLSQEVHPLFHRIQHVVNLAFGREPANAKSDTAVCTFVTVSKCPQDITWL